MNHKTTAFVSMSFALLHSCAIAHNLVDVQQLIPTIQVDLRYATTNNFMRTKIYASDRCYLRKDVALALKDVQEELLQMGVCLKIWDGYHSVSTERVLQEVMHRARGIDRAPEPGKHPRGTSIDCTLVWVDTDAELKMPTEFDDFSVRARRSHQGVSREAMANSLVLEAVMLKNGFIGSPDEWWHFDYQDWHEYELLDVELD